MHTYTDQTHPDAWIDFPTVETKRATWVQYFKNEPKYECPVCKGHGGWNIRKGAYELRPGMEDTQENRHKYSHFRASCFQCHGWGFVERKEDFDCVHEFGQGKRAGNCLTDYTCKKCGQERQVDSSG